MSGEAGKHRTSWVLAFMILVCNGCLPKPLPEEEDQKTTQTPTGGGTQPTKAPPSTQPEEKMAVQSNSPTTLTGHTSWVSGASFSPDGTQVVTASSDDTVKAWDTKSGKL